MDAVMARRRRSRIHATEAAHRRRRCSSSSAPLDSLPDDMLEAILLRLPRQPSSRPRASAVSRSWRGIVTNPMFHRRFHAHHRKAPLLGVFERRRQKFCFTPVLAAPDRIPAERLSISRWMTSRDCDATDCRHGRVLAIHRRLARLVVFAPLTGEEHCLAVRDEFRKCYHHHGAVLCAASGKEDHVHGFCHESPFKVALLSRYDDRYITSVYSSETGKFGDLVSMDAPFEVALAGGVPATLVGNVLYWMLSSNNVCAAMLEFDLDRQSLAVIEGPLGRKIVSGSHRIIKTEQGTVGWVRFSFPSLEIWLRKKNCHGIATWLQHKTVDMHDILGIPPRGRKKVWNDELLGYDEDNNVIILYVEDSAYMLDLKSMESTKLDESRLMKSSPIHQFLSARHGHLRSIDICTRTQGYRYIYGDMEYDIFQKQPYGDTGVYIYINK